MFDLWGWWGLGESICKHIISRTVDKSKIDPFSMIQRIKWKRMSICLVLGWYWWSLVSVMADWLSENRVVGSSMTSKSWVMRDLSHSASLEACITEMYSLSVVDSETISCHLAAQKTAPPCNKNVYPEIVCLSSAILPSASAYPFNSFCWPQYVNQNSFVPLR